MAQKTILHISADYPDTFAPNKTKAISNLVEGVKDYAHVVYSLNRVNSWQGIAAEGFGENKTQIIYKALPYSLFWRWRLKELAEFILADIQSKKLKPSLIHAHKFTVEGVVAFHLSKALDIPFVCSIQGNTDVKILKTTPLSKGLYQRIATEAKAVFPFAPWAQAAFEEKLGLNSNKCTLLPVISKLDELTPAPVVEGSKILSIFHLHGYKNKNIAGVIKALEQLKQEGIEAHLDVYGSGSEADIQAVQSLIENSSVAGNISLKGNLAHADLPKTIKAYSAFVMPSFSESYGLVYVEALFNGVPILFSKNRGISGYFKPQDIGFACNPKDTHDIAKGIHHLLTHQKELKENIARMQKEGGFEKVRRESILGSYTEVLGKIL